jgi:hypothetical protein
VVATIAYEAFSLHNFEILTAQAVVAGVPFRITAFLSLPKFALCHHYHLFLLFGYQVFSGI